MDYLFLQIGILFLLALIGGIVAIKTRQSTMVGYLLIGLLLSPSISFTFMGFHYGGFFVNNSVVSTFSQLGLVMILFFIGLNVNPQKFRKKSGVSILLALFDLSVLFIIGLIVGLAFSWDLYDSIFLGFIVSASSVVVSAKTMDDMRKLSSDASDALISMLVIEDIITIVMVTVFLGAIMTKAFWPGLLNIEFIGISAFLAFIIFLSLIFLPTIKRKFFSKKNEEIFVLFILSITFLISALLDIFNISPAIGAFFGGMLFSQTDVAKDIEPRLVSFKYAFGAIFFVTYGIGVDFSVFLNHADLILIIVAAIIFGEVIVTSSIAYLLGFSPKDSIFIGAGLIPRSEDSLIFANIANSVSYESKNLLPLSETLFSVTGAIVIITSIITPLFLKISSRLSRSLARIVPGNIAMSSSIISRTMRSIFFSRNIPIVRRNPFLIILSSVAPIILMVNFFTFNILWIIFTFIFFFVYIYFVHRHILNVVKINSFASGIGKRVTHHIDFLIISFFSLLIIESIIYRNGLFYVFIALLIFILLIFIEFNIFPKKTL